MATPPALEFTGERLVPDDAAHRDLYWEHLARYDFAARFAAGRRVLDLGCGCGYGSHHLVQAGATVVGLDNSAEALAYAQARYVDPHLSFRLGDARSTELPDASFDLIVCFELIEHIAEQAAVLAEIRRLLVADGCLLISTPDADRPERAPNPWHVKELRREEFAQLLGEQFAPVRLLAQRRFTGVLFEPHDDAASIAVRSTPADGTAVPPYWLAVCGTAPQALGHMTEVPYFQNLDELRLHLTQRDHDVAARDERVEALQTEVAEKAAWGQGLDRRVGELERQVQDREVQIVLRERERDDARATLGYRLHQRLAPILRRLWNWARGLGRAAFFLCRLSQALLAATPRALRRLARLPLVLRAWRQCRWLTAQLTTPAPATPVLPRLGPRDGTPPGVSVVIPTYNGRDLLARNLPSVVAEVAHCAFPTEILVVDDGSTDDTAAWLATTFPAVRVIRLPRNRGFAAAANHGVQEARHPIVYLCNNDMEILDGAFTHAAATLWRRGAFAVASAIIMREGGISHLETGLTTGGLVSGMLRITHHHDLGDQPRSTLYAGGGASAFDREAFLALGGFRALYHPFYAEDLDLSFRAWRAGFEVLVEPRSRAIHQHRGTIARVAGPEEIDAVFQRNLLLFGWANLTSPDLAREQVRALPRVLWRGEVSPLAWREAWQRHAAAIAERADGHGPWSDAEILAGAGRRTWDLSRTAVSRRARGRLKVLAIAPYCPYPPSHGGAVRMWELLTRLARRHEVHLAAMVEREAELECRSELEKHFGRVHLQLRGAPDLAPRWWPASVAELKSVAFERAVDRLAGEEDYDIIEVEYPILAHVTPPDGRAKKVITEIDVYHVAYRRATANGGLAQKVLRRYEWLRMFRYEATHADRADLLLAMSETDAAACRAMSRTQAAVIPNGVDVRSRRFAARPDDAREILFVGNFRHPPNGDGVIWFAQNVWPRVRDANWRARLLIAGASPPPEVQALAQDPSVEVRGYVPDLTPLWERCAAFVAPIRIGSGTRVKILEAMAAGAPVVSTRIGIEGIAATAGEDFLPADDPADFADACLRLLRDAALRSRLAVQARRLVERRYDWDAIADRLDAVWRELAR
jgi:GT2 family glycosyltransferase/glycosyltransferase involved in cell wall biosynthesis/SAM-dependent methyltransferase